MTVLPDPWRHLADDTILLAELGHLLRGVRRRIVRHLHHAGLTLEEIAHEAGVSRQRAAQWAQNEENNP